MANNFTKSRKDFGNVTRQRQAINFTYLLPDEK